MLHINLLGTPEIYQDNELAVRFRTRKAQALLIYLAITERSWPRDTLATLFWPETTDTRARKNLRDILPPLRRQLGDYLRIDDNIIGLAPASQYKCDVSQFRAVLEKPLQSIEIDLLTKTLALYRGEFIEGYRTSTISADFELWALRERERLHQLTLMGFTTLCQRQQAAGTYEAALQTNRQLLDLAPWDEGTHQQQMRLLAQSGQQAAALAHFERCRQILADELDVEPGAKTVQLYQQIKAGKELAMPAVAATSLVQEASPPKTQSNPIQHNLPRQLTNLIGRASEIDVVRRLLQEESTALLTLIGQGGVGKTRLALAVAQVLRQQDQPLFPDGIWFVPLAGIAVGEQATEQIAEAIAQAMGLSLTGSESLAKQIIRAMEGQQLLLILDNFEHLVAEQTFLLEMVQTAQQVKVLVTSREQLHLHAEHLYPVNGLPTPTEDDLRAGDASFLPTFNYEATNYEAINRAQPPVDFGQYAGVQLFAVRAQQRLPEFRLTLQNQQTIGHLCYLLGGVPLGLELAAQLYVEQGSAVLTRLITEIEQLDPLDAQAPIDSAGLDSVGLDHLQTTAIDLPDRQRSVRAVFTHSWHLLTEDEQVLLRHCAIFRGGFTREAVLAVADGKGAQLLALVAKSLVRRDSHDRYDLHVSVRQYVIDQFQQKPLIVHATAQKHAEYFANFLAGQEERLYQDALFHDTIRTELYNIRGAWQWLIEQAAVDAKNILLLNSTVTTLFHFFQFARRWQEILAVSQEAIQPLRQLLEPRLAEAPLAEPKQTVTIRRLLGYLLAFAAYGGKRVVQMNMVEEWVDEAMQISEAIDDAKLRTYVTLIFATIQVNKSTTDAEQLYNISISWAQRSAQPFLQVTVLFEAVRYYVSVFSPDLLTKATPNWEVAVQLIQTNRYHYLSGDALVIQGLMHQAKEEWDRALQAMQQGLELCQKQQGSISALDFAQERLGYLNLYIGNPREALQWTLLSYKKSKIQGNQQSMLFNLYTLGMIHTQLGEWSKAEAHLRELETVNRIFGDKTLTIVNYMGLGDLFNDQERFTEAASQYQHALQLVTTTNLPVHQALIQAGLALAYLGQGKPFKALDVLEPLLADDLLFSFSNTLGIQFASAAYPTLKAVSDPRADAILDRAYTLVQIESGKFQDTALRATFLENISVNRAIINFWQARDCSS